MGADPSARREQRLSRRVFLAATAGGIGAGVLGADALGPDVLGRAPGAWAATPNPSPKLPSEYFRRSNQVTAYAGTLYDDIAVRISGDPARMFVPQTIKPGFASTITVVWLLHGSGSDHNSIIGGFKTTAERIVDYGAIAICQNDGGTLYSHPAAQASQVAGYAYLKGIYDVASNVLRATSGGGALACETAAASLIPDIRGTYLVNGVYDIRALYDGEGDMNASVVAAFGDDPAAVDAANPARHPSADWAGKKLRVVFSQPDSSDRVVPPEAHAKPLLATAMPTASEATYRVHAYGHSTPPWANDDFIATLDRWVPVVSHDPVVSVTAPIAGATLSGTTTLRATASGEDAIAGVTFHLGTSSLGAGTLANGSWSLPFDTTDVANGSYAIKAVATDAKGRVGSSGNVAVTVRNTVADTTAPTVAITSPANGAVVKGTVTVTATAADAVGVTAVHFYAGATLLGSATSTNGTTWTLTRNTNTSATPNGTYPVKAVARDAAGNSTTSAIVTITVKN